MTSRSAPPQILTSAERFRFDASDLMPEQMNNAFLQAVVDYTADPSQLELDPSDAGPGPAIRHGTHADPSMKARPLSAPLGVRIAGINWALYVATILLALTIASIVGRPDRLVGSALPAAAGQLHPRPVGLLRRDVLRRVVRGDGLASRDASAAQCPGLDLHRPRPDDGPSARCHVPGPGSAPGSCGR